MRRRKEFEDIIHVIFVIMNECNDELIDAGYVNSVWGKNPARYHEVQFEGLSEPPIFSNEDDWKILFTTKGKLDVDSFKSKSKESTKSMEVMRSNSKKGVEQSSSKESKPKRVIGEHSYATKKARIKKKALSLAVTRIQIMPQMISKQKHRPHMKILQANLRNKMIIP